MIQIPRRKTLRDQTAAALRQGIEQGRWSGQLPSERELCHALAVSRITLRAAVGDLSKQGLLLPGGRGRFHRILSSGTVSRSPARVKIIRYLSCHPQHLHGIVSISVIQTLATHLARHGYRLEFECHPGLYRRHSEKELERLTTTAGACAWVLFGAPRRMQEWFQQCGQPCLVTGSTHPGVELPSVRFDFDACCRHAAHQFLVRGHRHIAFVTPAKRTASEEESVRGFLSAAVTHPGARLSVLEHDAGVEGLTQALLSSRLGQDPVTGYFSLHALQAITMLTFFQHHQVRVPQSLSIVSRANDVQLESLVPSIAHYRLNGEAMGAIAARMLAQGLERGSLALEHKTVMPDFVKGESLAPAPMPIRG